MPEQILIVKLSSLGDVIHTLPAAQALRRQYPTAHIAWAVERAHAGVLRGQTTVDEIIEWDRGSWRNLAAFVRRLRSRRWDLAVDFQGLFRSGFLTWASGARRRVGYAGSREQAHRFYNERIAPPTAPLHAVEKSLRLIEPLGATFPGLPLERPYLRSSAAAGAPGALERPPFPLVIGDAERKAVDAWLGAHRFDVARHRLVVLNPHCRKPANIWPAERFSQLAERLLEQHDIRVVLTGGPIARTLCDEIAAPLSEAASERVWRADGAFSLLGSAELIRRASLFVTGDTGPMHIAAAVGAPIVALFGPADPLKTGPYTSDAVVVSKRLPCAPCFAKLCPLGHRPAKCMDDISVDDAYTAAIGVLRRTSEQTVAQRLSA